MKKLLCLALIVLTIVCVFTGCSGVAYTTRGGRNGMTNNRAEYGYNDRGNVSTSRNGTVNGKNRTNSPKMGMEVEIGSGVR